MTDDWPDDQLRFWRCCVSCQSYNWCFLHYDEWICSFSCGQEYWHPDYGDEE